MICEIRFGSHLYGTTTETSDEDFKGVFLPTAEEILLGRIPRTFHASERDDTRKNLPGEADVEYYSLHHFLRLATQGQTGAVDMLFAPENMIFKDATYGWIWDEIAQNRKLLLSKQMHAFIDYARGQATKYSLKGERLNQLIQFKSVLQENTDHLLPLSIIWDQLPKDDERINPQDVRELQIAGKWFGESTPIRYVLHAINNAIDRYGKRANAASEASGIDWKALSHAVRVAKELIEILSFGQIEFPLRDSDLILKIKTGKVDFEEVQNILDRDLAFIEFRMQQSTLPDQIDTTFWDNWLLSIIRKTL